MMIPLILSELVPIEVLNLSHAPVTLKPNTIIGHSVPLGENSIDTVYQVSALSQAEEAEAE